MHAQQSLVQELRDRKQAPEAEGWHEAWLNFAHEAVITTDAERVVTRWNAAAQELYGWTEAEAIGQDIRNLLRTQEPCGTELIDDVLRARGRWDGELVYTRRDGSALVAESRRVLIRAADGTPAAYLQIDSDITEHKLAAEALRESEATLASFYHSAPILMGVVEAGDSDILHISGAKPPWASQLRSSAMDTRFWLERCREAERYGKPVHFEFHSTRDAQLRVFSVTVACIGPANSGDARFSYVAEDITDRKNAETRPLDQLRVTDAVTSNSPDALFLLDSDGRVTYSNPAATRLLGPGPENRLPQLPIERVLQYGETLRNAEQEITRQDGARIAILCSVEPIWKEGAVAGAVLSTHDISELKRAEERIRHSQKMESTGVLAGGVAHDFNNLLTGIMGYASLLEDSVRDPDQRSIAKEIMRSSEAAADLTRQMLAYAGKTEFIMERLDISDLVRNALPLLQAAMPKKVRLQFNLPDSLPETEGDSAQLRQVLMNLAINSAEAIGSREGSVTIALSLEEIRSELPDIAGLEGDEAVVPGQYVCLTVEDTGCGMDAATKARIFDPFYSTKFTGRGLGLAAVAGIVRGHHGYMAVTSRPGFGTRFRVFLPRAGWLAEHPGTVLIVDDEAVIRNLARRALERQGFRTVTASDGREAVELLSGGKQQISLVLLDITKPVTDGHEALPHLLKLRPELKVLVSSGFDEGETRRHFARRSIAGFVRKPYTAAQLVQAVKAAVGHLTR